MNLAYAIPLLVALGCVWYLGRRIARRRKKERREARRERNERQGLRSFAPAKTKRSEMRTDDDPTTVMGRITETRPPPSVPRQKRKKG
ncbi:MAG: hypothetical protein ABI607_12980 [Betaproteobacteria bacterium]